MTKTYTQRSNCVRAAKVALGKTAKPDVDFNITGSAPAFSWVAIQKAPAPAGAKKPKRVKGDAQLKDQPQMVKLLAACASKDGATIESLATLLGGVEQHTVRAAISRLRGEGIKFDTAMVERRKVYKLTTGA